MRMLCACVFYYGYNRGFEMNAKEDKFKSLFLTKEQEEIFKLKKLEKEFILSENEMLDLLRKRAIEYNLLAKSSYLSYMQYRKRILK